MNRLLFSGMTALAGLFPLMALAADPAGKGPLASDRCAVEKPGDDVPSLPGGDIFGFTSATNIGTPCKWGYANENTLRAGRADGSYFAWNHKSELSYTFTERFALAVSGFATYNNWSNVTAASNAAPAGETANSAVNFDGFSFEPSFALLKRSKGQPWALTFSVEPRWARVEALTGFAATTLGAEFKLRSDVVLSENVFAAFNAIYGLGTWKFDIPGAINNDSSTLVAAGALTWRAFEKPGNFISAVYLGVEGRFLASYAGTGLNRFSGSAFFAGPNMAFEFANGSVLNLVWTPQLTGGAVTPTIPRNLDLDNFDAHAFRIKYAMELN